MPLLTIEGNIGSGKSTIVKALREFAMDIDGIPVVFVDEPVHQWEQVVSSDNKNMIELFYGDQKKYAFSFQMMAYISRLALLKEAILNNPRSVIITERCLLTDYNVFAKLLYENGAMLEEEYTIYKKWFHYFQQEIEISGIIYVKTDVSVAKERCAKRNRLGETISIDYLEQCHRKHEEWVKGETSSILTIDNNETEMETILFMIQDFVSDIIYDHPDFDEPMITPMDYAITLRNILLFLWGYVIVGKELIFHYHNYLCEKLKKI